MTVPSSVRPEPVAGPVVVPQAPSSRVTDGRVDRLGANRSRRAAADLGMTLVEMLIVLAIIGIASGGVALAIGSATRAPSVESEARRFATRLEAAGDDAMLGDRMIALTVDDSGYGFVRVPADGAIPKGTPKLDRHALPGGVAMTLDQAPPLVLGMNGQSKPLLATLVSGEQCLVVRYDGLTATVTRAAVQTAGALPT